MWYIWMHLKRSPRGSMRVSVLCVVVFFKGFAQAAVVVCHMTVPVYNVLPVSLVYLRVPSHVFCLFTRLDSCLV